MSETKAIIQMCLEAQEAASLIIESFPIFKASTIPEPDKQIIKEAIQRMLANFEGLKADLLPDQIFLTSTIDLTVSKLNDALALLNGVFRPACLGIVIKINID